MGSEKVGNVGEDLVSSNQIGPVIVQPMLGGAGASGVSPINASTPTKPMSWHNGAVMTTNPLNIYLIYYGNWPTNSTTPTILQDFASNIGGTPWYDVNSTYYNGANGVHVPNAVHLGGTARDTGSQGTALTTSKIAQIVTDAITKADSVTLRTPLPPDENGIYAVVTSSNVTVSDPGQALCSQYCAWHTSMTANVRGINMSIKFALVADYSTQCPAGCGVQNPSPNGNPAADAMVNTFAHEFAEAASDPTGGGWYGASGSEENGDLCNFDFGTTYTTPSCGNSSCANVHVGSRDYRIQRNYVNLGAGLGTCGIRHLRKNDIFWRNKNTGDVVVQHGDGAATPTFTLTASALSLDWLLVGKTDVDGDDNDDFVWRNTKTGDVVIWEMNGPTPKAAQLVFSALPLAWVTVGTGDFDGDGKGDILWRNTQTGDVVIWFMNGFGAKSSATVAAALSSDWQTAGTGDLNGDGITDILWRNVKNGDTSGWLMNGNAFKQVTTFAPGVSLAWVIIGVGDFDGNGKSDVLLQNTVSKDVSMWLMDGLTIKTVANPKAAWTGYELVGVGDFDGNGNADIMWRNTSTQNLLTWRMNGTTIAGSFTPLTASNPTLISNGTFSDQN